MGPQSGEILFSEKHARAAAGGEQKKRTSFLKSVLGNKSQGGGGDLKSLALLWLCFAFGFGLQALGA